MFTLFYDVRTFALQFIKPKLENHLWGKKVFGYIKSISAWALKVYIFKLLIMQEYRRMEKIITFQYFKYDSGLEAYNLFSGRSDLIGKDQPESVFFIDKFM